MAKRKWYVVTRGKNVGVFKTWLEVAPLVTSVSGALHQSFPTEEEAWTIFEQERSKGNVKVVGDSVPAASPSPRPPTVQAESFSRAPQQTSRAARVGDSKQNLFLNLPLPSEETLASPPTGVTQVCVLPESPTPLSPVALPKAGFADQMNKSSPRHTSSSSSSSSTVSSNLSSFCRVEANHNSCHSCQTVTINLKLHHIQCSSCGDRHLTALSSGMMALGLSESSGPQPPPISRMVDPRSPLTFRALAPPGSPQPSSSRRPSPRISGEGASVLFS
ncbi:hypothetical protein B0H10DRAFT_622648 [Mycena sp. CBHHK59/15]|nr:hypothetical protein B0H10DRAFT_622648 [Mycena sp. CBHHK59/15]